MHNITELDYDLLDTLLRSSDKKYNTIKDLIISKLNTFYNDYGIIFNYKDILDKPKYSQKPPFINDMEKYFKNCLANDNKWCEHFNELLHAEKNRLYFETYNKLVHIRYFFELKKFYNDNFYLKFYSRNIFNKNYTLPIHFFIGKDDVLSYLYTPIDIRINHFADLCDNLYNYKLENDDNLRFRPLISSKKDYINLHCFPPIYPSDIIETSLDDSFNKEINKLNIYIKKYNFLSFKKFDSKIKEDKFLDLYKECQSILDDKTVSKIDLYFELRRKVCEETRAAALIHPIINHDRCYKQNTSTLIDKCLRILLETYNLSYHSIRSEGSDYEEIYQAESDQQNSGKSV
ncbi:MAG: hypothetical protein LBT86_09605 [Deltaproteobacteria bacterium]|nr:hypothetical protein [Deltaproteobacteria bacterium]